MNINFQVIKNTPDEIFMGHKIWFKAVPGCDVVSATANAPGFTPLIAVARHFGWDYDMIERAAVACNASNKILFLHTVSPTLMLVPATRGRGDNKIIWNYFKALHELAPKCLHFTHYGFLQGKLPAIEVSRVLDLFLGLMPPTSLQTITFDIDERRSQDFYKLMRPSLPEPDVDPWA
ncbi:hypothetical protein MCEMIEM28_01354 [Burkholderiaceae bacterium]